MFGIDELVKKGLNTNILSAVPTFEVKPNVSTTAVGNKLLSPDTKITDAFKTNMEGVLQFGSGSIDMSKKEVRLYFIGEDLSGLTSSTSQTTSEKKENKLSSLLPIAAIGIGAALLLKVIK